MEITVEIDITGEQLYQYLEEVLDYKSEYDEDCKLIKWIELFAYRFGEINDLEKLFISIIERRRNAT